MTISPTAAPSMSDAAARPRVRRITQADLSWALSEGWGDFKAKRGDILMLAVIYPIVGLAAVLFVFNGSLLPMLFPLAAGLSIFGPAAASGFYEIARRRELGLDSSWLHFLDPMQGRGRSGLLLLTALLALVFAAWLSAAWIIYAATMWVDHPVTRDEFLGRLFSTHAGLAMILIGNLAGFLFACLTLVVAVVSFPMMVDRPVGADVAVATSIRAVMANPNVMASWGLRVAVLLALGCVPFFFGLAIVVPVLGYATWHLYTRLVER